MPINITAKKINEEMNTKAVTIFGLQSYNDAKLTFATASGIKSSMKIMPFIIGSSSINDNTIIVSTGSIKNLNPITQISNGLLISLILVPYR